MNFEENRKEFLDELRADSAANGTDAGDEFLTRVCEILEGLGELQEPQIYYFGKTFSGNRIMQIDGYSFNTVDNSLSLIICDFEDSYNPEDINRKQIEDVLAKRLRNFLELSYNDEIKKYCDDSDKVLSLARMIRTQLNDNMSGILKVRFIIITNKKLSDKVRKIKQPEFLEKPVEINVWHIERILEAMAAFDSEPIVINFKNDFGGVHIPCLKAEIGENLDYHAYIAIIPGKVLADIYIEYGSRVLEGNVRAFLGASGQKSVNSGIRRTIKEDPTKFFTYNNGIASTASRIKLEEINGQTVITELEDLQIINGGQTTASLAAAVLKKENPTLEGIFIPAKITVIEDRETTDDAGVKFYDTMVQKISRYANSQNRVTAADFFSNSPFHVIMERLSKRCYAPPVNGALNPTCWYYERSRKKYEQEQVKFTKAQRDKFQQRFPKKQVITKEKLAKYMFCIECKPHIVSKGGNWVMKEFGTQMEEVYRTHKESINELYFKKAVGAAIIFNTVDSIVAHAPWYQKGGPKLNIVPYTISKIVSSIPEKLTINWNQIWQHQALQPQFVHEIEIVAKLANDFIADNCGSMIVTEFCKKAETWEKFKSIKYEPSIDFLKSLILKEDYCEDEKAAFKGEQNKVQLDTEIELYNLGSVYWQKLYEESSRMKLLTEKESSLLKIAASIEKTKTVPTPKQAKAIMAIRDRLENQGIFISNS